MYWAHLKGNVSRERDRRDNTAATLMRLLAKYHFVSLTECANWFRRAAAFFVLYAFGLSGESVFEANKYRSGQAASGKPRVRSHRRPGPNAERGDSAGEGSGGDSAGEGSGGCEAVSPTSASSCCHTCAG